MAGISVALCTYNGEKYVAELLASLAAQTALPCELIVQDDCSADDTVATVRDFARTAPFPVQVKINRYNLGHNTNFKYAVGACTGDIIAQCDQDDVWLPEKLERIAQAFQTSSRVGLVFSNALVVDHELRPLGHELWDCTFTSADRARAVNGELLEVLLGHNVVTGATMAFRSCYRNHVLPIPAAPGLIHDRWVALIIATIADVEPIDLPLIKYRLHADQQAGLGVAFANRLSDRSHQVNPVFSTYGGAIAYFRNEIDSVAGLAQLIKARIESAEPAEYPERSRKWPIQEARINAELLRRQLTFEPRIAHLHVRCTMRHKSWSQRLQGVANELRSRRYHYYSNGIRSALKDALGLNRQV